MIFLNVLSETWTNGYRVEALDFISLTSILCGILVVICKNPIRSVLFLIGLFVSIACYLMFLGLDFLGIAYLLVYVGAVSILFLFILMLINVRISELLSDTGNSIFLAIIIGILFYTCVNLIYPSVVQLYNQAISLATSQSWDGYLAVSSHITSIGNIMYTSYSIWLIITSIILLLAMVGAIVITIKWESNTSTNIQSTFAGFFYNTLKKGILRFFLNLSLSKIIKTIRFNIIFRSLIIYIIGFTFYLFSIIYIKIKCFLIKKNIEFTHKNRYLEVSFEKSIFLMSLPFSFIPTFALFSYSLGIRCDDFTVWQFLTAIAVSLSLCLLEYFLVKQIILGNKKNIWLSVSNLLQLIEKGNLNILSLILPFIVIAAMFIAIVWAYFISIVYIYEIDNIGFILRLLLGLSLIVPINYIFSIFKSRKIIIVKGRKIITYNFNIFSPCMQDNISIGKTILTLSCISISIYFDLSSKVLDLFSYNTLAVTKFLPPCESLPTIESLPPTESKGLESIDLNKPSNITLGLNRIKLGLSNVIEFLGKDIYIAFGLDKQGLSTLEKYKSMAEYESHVVVNPNKFTEIRGPRKVDTPRIVGKATGKTYEDIFMFWVDWKALDGLYPSSTSLSTNVNQDSINTISIINDNDRYPVLPSSYSPVTRVNPTSTSTIVTNTGKTSYTSVAETIPDTSVAETIPPQKVSLKLINKIVGFAIKQPIFITIGCFIVNIQVASATLLNNTTSSMANITVSSADALFLISKLDATGVQKFLDYIHPLQLGVSNITITPDMGRYILNNLDSLAVIDALGILGPGIIKGHLNSTIPPSGNSTDHILLEEVKALILGITNFLEGFNFGTFWHQICLCGSMYLLMLEMHRRYIYYNIHDWANIKLKKLVLWILSEALLGAAAATLALMYSSIPGWLFIYSFMPFILLNFSLIKKVFINRIPTRLHSTQTSFSLGRDLLKEYPMINRGKGNIIFTSDGREVFDASCGAAVSCLGHGNQRVIKAISMQLDTGITYLASSFWANRVVEDLCQELIKGTGGIMAKVYLTGSGSEAMEAAIKLSRQYFFELNNNTARVNFIARKGSYHGNTTGALAVSGHLARRKPYIPLLMENVHFIPACNAYRQRLDGESDAAFVVRKAEELETKFQVLGPDTVIGFIAEPVVGAALGCVPYVPGYLKAMREICHKHGALFMLDEVMCGIGRTGTLHAWQAENVVPDIQTIGKGLGGGYQPIAAVMVNHKIVNVLLEGNGQFIHGQTYQSMPVQAAAALEVQRIIREDKLMVNVLKQGSYLEKQLKAVLDNHPNVGDIRGLGLFLGIEFVKDKVTKDPFDPKLGFAQKIHDLAISPRFNMVFYPGTGTVDGVNGDHIILAPSFLVTEKDVDHIVKVVSTVIETVFK